MNIYIKSVSKNADTISNPIQPITTTKEKQKNQ